MAKKQKKKVNWLKESGDALTRLLSGVKGLLTGLLFVVVTLGIIGVLCGLIMGAAFAVYLSNYVDSSIERFELLANEQKQTSHVFVINDGNLDELDDQKLYATENRVWVNYEVIPQDLVNAYVSTEDKRFWDHNGVDWIRTTKATLYYVLGRSGAGGGSTLTQQLIKNVTGEDENSAQRKVEEIFRALNLEKEYSKEQIMEMYLNTIYLSQGCNGVQAASYTYFNKPVSQLSLLECAAIASITQNPSRWDPKVHPENNIIRRNSILTNMLDQGKITKAAFDEAYDQPLTVYEATEPDDIEDPGQDDPTPGYTNANSWYVDVVIEDSIELLMQRYDVTYKVAEQMLYTGGFRIVTAMDKDVQSILEEVYASADTIDSIVGASPGMIKPQSAMIVLDPRNGNILGLVGGRGEKQKSRVFNYATMAKRQTGSSIKPLSVYAPSLEAGIIHYGTVFDDSPYNYPSKDKGWPKNSPAGYKGLTPIITGITNSVNTIAVKLADTLGLQTSFDFLVNKLHIGGLYESLNVNGTVVSDKTLSALALGGMTYGVSVRDLVGGYTMFTNDGVYCRPRAVLKITDSEGNVIVDNQPQTEVCLTRENASIMTSMLNSVVLSGTGKTITLKDEIFTAGKTGTTSKNNDKWFVGYTKYYLAATWFGYEKPQTLSSFSGNPAMKIWDYTMKRLHNEMVYAVKEDGTPDPSRDRDGNPIPKTYEDVRDVGVLTLEFCRDCGGLATDACKKDSRGSRVMSGYFTLYNMPTASCSCHKTIRVCSVSGMVAGSACPDALCKEVTIVVTASAQHRYDGGVYVYRSDEKYVFYDKGNGTYGGLSKTYSEKCTVHKAASYEMPASTLALPPDAAEEADKHR